MISPVQGLTNAKPWTSGLPRWPGARGAATDRRHPRGDDVRHRQLTCSRGTGRVGLLQTAVTLAETTSATASSRALEARGAWGCYRPPSPSRDDVRHRQLTCSRGTGRVGLLQTAVTLAVTTSATDSSRALEARGAWGCQTAVTLSVTTSATASSPHVLSRHGARGAADRRHPRGDDVRHRQLTCSRGTGRVGLLQTAVTLAVTTSATASSPHVLSRHGARGAADRRHPRGDDVRHRQLTSRGTGAWGCQTAVTLAVTTSATASSRALEARGAWGCRPPSPSQETTSATASSRALEARGAWGCYRPPSPRGDDVRHRQLTCSRGTGRVGLQTAVTLAVTTSAASSRALEARGAWGCYPPSPSRRRRPPPPAHVLEARGAWAATDRRHPRGDDVRHRQLTCSRGTGRVGLLQTAVTLAVTTSATASSRALEARGAWGCYRPPSPSR
ncbi:hypothetical protein EVAR_23015_1 [Eumeta japonica]|uniref:Uncharacterized protein n=1 Tax=Eumeta variegata TaxID=151549 RepID=A0A4C1UQQ1_EUMVA|nr:hypothetical protein EVAR_23015_1 [Eumeta japonica]